MSRNRDSGVSNASLAPQTETGSIGMSDLIRRFPAGVAERPRGRPDRGRRLETPTPPPDAILDPRKPTFVPPEAPKGLLASLFGKKKHAMATAQARETYERTLREWRTVVRQLPAKREAAAQAHAKAEAERLAALQAARAEVRK